MRNTPLWTLGAALSILSAGAVVAAEPDLSEDGWYRWEVAAGPEGRESCCHHFRRGNVSSMGCTFDRGADHWQINSQSEPGSGSMHIYVAVRDGKVREIHPLSSQCRVSHDDQVRTLENVSSAESIAWLRSLIEEQPGMANEAIMTLSLHREDEALPALIGILEDQQQNQENREQALFWMAHSDSDLAYAYLERLLDP